MKFTTFCLLSLALLCAPEIAASVSPSESEHLIICPADLAPTFENLWNTGSRWTSLNLTLLGDPAMAFRAETLPVPARPSTFGGLEARYRDTP